MFAENFIFLSSFLRLRQFTKCIRQNKYVFVDLDKQHVEIAKWACPEKKSSNTHLLPYIVKSQYLASKDIYFLMWNYKNRKHGKLADVVNLGDDHVSKI